MITNNHMYIATKMGKWSVMEIAMGEDYSEYINNMEKVKKEEGEEEEGCFVEKDVHRHLVDDLHSHPDDGAAETVRSHLQQDHINQTCTFSTDLFLSNGAVALIFSE